MTAQTLQRKWPATPFPTCHRGQVLWGVSASLIVPYIHREPCEESQSVVGITAGREFKYKYSPPSLYSAKMEGTEKNLTTLRLNIFICTSQPPTATTPATNNTCTHPPPPCTSPTLPSQSWASSRLSWRCQLKRTYFPSGADFAGAHAGTMKLDTVE